MDVQLKRGILDVCVLAAIKNERCDKFKYDPPDGGCYG